jgi:hypothetical protein
MRALTSVGLRPSMGPLTRENRPASQSIKLSALMAAAIVYAIIRLTGTHRMYSQPTEQRRNRSIGDILALVLIFTMLRARGRPRRGAGWYATDSRRKRHKRFERALVLAKRKRRRETIATNSPPRTYVEEISTMELPPDFSKSRMFIVPDNWNPPACIEVAEPPPSSRETHGPSDAPNEEFATCLVEEELPGCNTDSQPQRKTQGHQEMDAKPESPPLPPLLHPKHLKLIFEVRNLVDDQIFGMSMLANAWTCYTQPTPAPHHDDNAPPALSSMSFLSAAARRRKNARTPVNRFFCLAWSSTPFLLMFIRAIALLVVSLVSVSIGLTKLLMKMDMHPGFLRAGWRNELFDFACYSGQASCLGFLHRRLT